MHARRQHAINLALRDGGRSRFIVTGDVDSQEWLDAYERFLQAEPAGHVLWDLTEGSLAVLSSADVRDLALRVEAIREGRQAGGRFAFVCPRDVDFGIARMLVTYAGCSDPRAPMQVFRDLEEAWRWLSCANAAECLRENRRSHGHVARPTPPAAG